MYIAHTKVKSSVLVYIHVAIHCVMLLFPAVVRKVETAHTEAEPECCSTSESAIPRDSLSAVCKALDSHPTARVFLTRALVTAASLCAAGEGISSENH